MGARRGDYDKVGFDGCVYILFYGPLIFVGLFAAFAGGLLLFSWVVG